jgi:hypothetical protein
MVPEKALTGKDRSRRFGYPEHRKQMFPGFFNCDMMAERNENPGKGNE